MKSGSPPRRIKAGIAGAERHDPYPELSPHSTRSSGSPTTRSAGLGDSPGYEHAYPHRSYVCTASPCRSRAMSGFATWRSLARPASARPPFSSTSWRKTSHEAMDSSSLIRMATSPKSALARAAFRNNQVCYVNLTDSAYPVGFNVLEDLGPDHRAVVADGIVAGMRAIWTDMWGPRLEQILRHSMRGAHRNAERIARAFAAASHRCGLSRPRRLSRRQSPDARLFRTAIQ